MADIFTGTWEPILNSGPNSSVLYAFVDESGNHDLEVEKPGASNLYVCVAVLVDDTQLEAVTEGMAGVIKEVFGGAEAKSSRIGSDQQRRLRVLRRVSGLDFGYYALVVDKARIRRDSGLQFKPSFFKFLSQTLYRKLCAGGVVRLEVVADEYGGRAFMGSFVTYLGSKGFPNLYSDFHHQFVKSSEGPLVQLADLIAGSLTYVYDPQKAGEHSQGILDLLGGKQVGIFVWLPSHVVSGEERPDQGGAWDSQIRASSINGVLSFEGEHGDSDIEDRQMQIEIIRHLLFVREYGEEGLGEAVHAEGLIQHLTGLGFPALTKQSFSSRVIGPIRDAGLILAGSKNGYRIAMTWQDVRLFLEHDDGIIGPMISRLKVAREILRKNTSNRIDILSSPEYSLLKSLVEAYEVEPLSRVGLAEEGEPDV